MKWGRTMSSKENGGLSKNELIKKLEAISVLHKKALSVKSEMDNFEPEDNYERKIIVPVFPGDYENEEDREYLEESIDHENEDAVEQISEVFDDCYLPKEPSKPNYGTRPENDSAHSNALKQKQGCLPIVAGFIAVCSLVSGGLFSGDSGTMIMNIVILIACVVAGIYFYLNLGKAKKTDEEATITKIESYEKEKKEKADKYNQDMIEYQTSLDSYKLQRADFIDEYTNWRKVYLESLNEEAEIEEKLEADRIAAVKKIEAEEFMPLLRDMAELNDLVATDYLPALDIIIDLLKSGRADDLKEAINLYEDIVYRERQLQLQREQEEQRRYEEECRRADEERRHREEMEFREEQERQRRYDEELRQRKEDERLAKEKEERKKADELAKREAKSRCHWCTNYHNCSIRHNPPLNCTGFRPGSTHQI